MGKTYRNVAAQSDSESMYGSPHNRGFARSKKSIKIVGITGTNGKSSTAFFLHQLLSFKDSNATLLTNTPEVSNLKNTQFTPLTTPDNFLLHHFLKKSIDLKRKYFLMEVSSHGIDQSSISGLDIKALPNANICL